MLAPERFVEWMSANRHVDKKYGHVYCYHSRSDRHSIALCQMVMEDLVEACPVLKAQGQRNEVVYGINLKFVSAPTGKPKTLDLAIGLPATTAAPPKVMTLSLENEVGNQEEVAPSSRIRRVKQLSDLFFSCEAKSTMTEHGKSKPRMFDELSSSHEIVHRGNPTAIATGLTLVNIAQTFISPLRNRHPPPLEITHHKQPKAAEGMISHLRGLQMRDVVGEVGLDAFATLVVACDNQLGSENDARVSLWTQPPAPQPGEMDHYETFIERVSRFYAERFSVIPQST